ncbi:RNA methyltransferase [Hyunsoonleella sp. SJ7]|uniref:RNA methyltransferase n=1 Tax=Hyunsoonleella aquatilis TaxID=2762758 RepID=A0A923KL59_9FLAO|nr:RNA methyltransferase [Hyunsoonleella aquatilis]MBC3758528.1 RNA methyltransferase [Hyunsoonleella aquatilis]
MNKQNENTKSSLRKKADEIKDLRCKNLIAVLEEPTDIKNIATVVRNINALGVEKLYIIDGKKRLPESWEEMRERKSLLKPSVSAIKWSFVKTFSSTEECIEHLEKKRFTSIATSPHTKGKTNLYLQNGNYTQKRLAVWFGNEARGISELAVENCQACVQIQMAGIIESMNLATSTGIVLYEITKQRREYQAENKRGRKIDPEIIAE